MINEYQREKLQGVFCPLTTPFYADGSVNIEGLEQNVRKYASSGVAGHLILGSNGENKSLSTQEKLDVVSSVLANKEKNQTAMVASIFESTRETIAFAREAGTMGADFITLLSPSYFKSSMTDEALIRYFTDVASAVDTPCLLYNAPQFSGGITLSAKVIRQCAAHPNIGGVKDSSGGIQKLLLDLDGSGFTVLSGSANTFFESLLLGAAGGIISLANSMPDIVVRLYLQVMQKEYESAVKLNSRILKANTKISGKSGVAGVKAAMDLCGYIGGLPRLPLLPAGQAELDDIRATLAFLR